MNSEVRTYGGWRERRGFGVAGLSGRQTAVALVAVFTLLVLALVNPGLLAVLGLPLLAAVVVATMRVKGESLLSAVGRHGMWTVARRRGWTRYRAIGNTALPGVLRALTMLEAQDSAGRTVGLLWNARVGTLSAVVPLEPVGLSFVSDSQIRQWVHAWGRWLTQLGYLPGVRHMVVTVHTGPSPPGDQVYATHESADSLAADVMRQLEAEEVAQGSRTSRTVITIATAVANESELDQATNRLLELIAGMDSSVAACGVAVLPAMSAEDLIVWVRCAFEPGAAASGATGTWTDARPTATEEFWDRYQHDSVVSAAFTWDETPAESAPPEVLVRLLGPSDYRKRVSLVFEPIPAHEAAREVDRQAEAAVFRSQYRRRLGRDETARDRMDLEKARQTATEQAAGAGLVDVGLYAVVTADTEAELSRCASDLINRAGESRIRLRRNYGAQAATFAATVGVGFVPPRGL